MVARVIEHEHGYVQLIEQIDWLMPNALIVHMIFVHPRERGKGYGREMLADVIRWADRLGVILMLAPVPDEDCLFDLEAWYERNGFEWTSESRMMMFRVPQITRKNPK